MKGERGWKAKFLPVAGELVDLGGWGENDESNFRIAQNRELPRFLQQTVPTFGEGHLTVYCVLDTLQLHPSPSPSHFIADVSVSLANEAERHSFRMKALYQVGRCMHMCVFEDKELYQKTFGDDGKCNRFLRWRIQLLEKGIQQLSFRTRGINSMVHITNLKNYPRPGKRGLRQATKQALAIPEDNHPEFIARKVSLQ
eukprot:Gb_30605 [translate_table: standard]